jgi:hypothetical protein
MKKTIVWFAVICLLTIGPMGAANAQLVVGLNAGAVVPISDFSDIAGTGFGGDVLLGVWLTESWMINLMAGYHQFGEEDVGPVDISGAFIPIRLGIRKFWGASKRFYTSPQLGIFIGADDFEDKEEFGLGSRIGYQFPFGSEDTRIDVGVEFNNVFTDIDDKDVRYFGIDVGVEFGL